MRKLPPDSKIEELKRVLADLRVDGYAQVMVFTQYTDTMDFIRAERARDSDLRVICFSGRGGEIRDPDGTWRTVSHDDIKRRFREGKADVLVCSDAAAEGLNFQFCGALMNYDLPWNPMRAVFASASILSARFRLLCGSLACLSSTVSPMRLGSRANIG